MATRKLETNRSDGLSANLKLAAAIAAALAAPAAAWAQQAPAPLETVTVSGIRAGIQNAIAVKRESTSIVESISAEDIGKLPDTSIAESISRLPGLTSQRAEGRASAISLRGTDPGFTTALLNGREQVSTGDNRNVEFDQYPSELLNSVVVYKTPDSQLAAQGLAGTIDLRTIRPLQYGRSAMALNFRGEQNSNDDLGANADENGYRASFSFVDQFMDGRFGVAFGYAHLDSPMATRGYGTYEPWNASGGGDTTFNCPQGTADACQFNPGVAPGQFETDGIKVRADMGSTVRDGFMATFQFEPTENYSGIIDLYYSTMEQTDNARSLEVNLTGYPATCCDGAFPDGTIFGYSNTTIENDTVVAGTLNNVTPLVRNFLFTTDDEIVAAGWRNEFRLNDTWTVVGDVSYSKATRDQLQPEVNAQFGPTFVFDTGTFELRGNNHMPSLSFPLDYADPTQIVVGPPQIYGAGYTKKPHVEDELTSYRVDALRAADMGWFVGTAFGLNVSYRSKDKSSPESGLGTIDGPDADLSGDSYQIADEFLLRPTDLGYADAGNIMAIDVNAVLAEYFNPINYGDPESLPYLAGKYWYVKEDVITGFVRGDLSHDISDSVTLKGNVGFQVIRTDQSSTSYLVAYSGTPNQVVQTVGDGKEYTDVLPQLNFAFMMPNEQAIRVGLAKELARARMDQLKATEESGYNFTTGEPSGNGGNPRLDPWEAWALDVSYEKYIADSKGYFSVAAFYKDLETYIFSQTEGGHDFSELQAATPPGLFPPGVTPQATGNFTHPQNGSGGYLWGLEFTASLPFEMFADSLDGFGAILSYSYTDSDIEIPGSISSVANDHIPLPGLSKDVWNATLYYEKYGFGARIATRYRSQYIGEVTNFANERGFRFVDADMITDAQVSYTFGESGVLHGLQLLFQVNNVTNEPYIAYSQDKSRVLDYQEYGTQYLLGVNYKF